MTSTAPRRKVLISGAGIAGPALAYWLNRHGHEVTVVEKAARAAGRGRRRGARRGGRRTAGRTGARR
ncbi:FAD-dependent oxidoreductase [Streptomyces olivaceus]|uniref:FAD-dependent oxidoreductase n=1 Tax=Streptomyces olivaceus TaxID=47716 RepID=UPI0033B180D6